MQTTNKRLDSLEFSDGLEGAILTLNGIGNLSGM